MVDLVVLEEKIQVMVLSLLQCILPGERLRVYASAAGTQSQKTLKTSETKHVVVTVGKERE